MIMGKKGKIMRHPYAMLAIIGLATAGALTIGSKVKSLVCDKMADMKGLMHNMKKEY